MNTRKSYQLANQFRAAILFVPKSDFPWNSSMAMSQFPAGCCGDATRTLATYLYRKSGIIYDYALGACDGLGSHAWLEISETAIDITADQFNNRGFCLPEIHVGPRLSFHNLFTVTLSSDARHTALNNNGSLDGVYACVENHLRP